MSASPSPQPIVALAAAAHPDDIEFMMAGTLLLLKDAGAEIHMWNLASGHCGTARHSREEIIRLRAAEAETSARLAGAVSHAPLFDDLGIFYDQPSLSRVAAVVREIRPTILLTHAPQDYMEDHQNTCRLLVTAAFAHGMRNFETQPPRPAWDAPVALYHALPHGLRDGMGQRVRPDAYADTSAVLERKRAMLACHRSQKEWLDVSQGMDAYLIDMERLSAEVGRWSRRYVHAEGWRLHSTLGFAPATFNPLQDLLKGNYHATTAE
ncbi:MAG: PIG-L family deacetylase [Lentisphaerae bacterium]|nr:PIG-L family deacetylase [Lentisphaerota bacterium]